MIVFRALLLIVMLFTGVLAQAWLSMRSEARAQSTREAGPVGDPLRGEKIALSCATCHGEAGMSKAEWIPSLAGMNQDVIYKQLDDYRSHRRRPEWYMASVAQALSLQDSADVSAYYAGQSHRFAEPFPSRGLPDSAASCGACHNGQLKNVPEIAGQQSQYLEIQLSLFAQGIRSNDRDEVMRKIASQLSNDDIRRISESLGKKSH
jgi:cytochrome c553